MVCIDKTVLVFEDLSYGLQTQWEVSRFGRLCTRYVHTISCFRLLSTSSCVTSELLPRESDTPIDEDFSNSHEPTGGPDMHGHAGLPLPRREWGGLIVKLLSLLRYPRISIGPRSRETPSQIRQSLVRTESMTLAPTTRQADYFPNCRRV